MAQHPIEVTLNRKEPMVAMTWGSPHCLCEWKFDMRKPLNRELSWFPCETHVQSGASANGASKTEAQRKEAAALVLSNGRIPVREEKPEAITYQEEKNKPRMPDWVGVDTRVTDPKPMPTRAEQEEKERQRAYEARQVPHNHRREPERKRLDLENPDICESCT